MCRVIREVGKMPGEEEFVIGGLVRVNGPPQTERADGTAVFRLGTEFAIGCKIIPKQKRRIPPAASCT